MLSAAFFLCLEGHVSRCGPQSTLTTLPPVLQTYVSLHACLLCWCMGSSPLLPLPSLSLNIFPSYCAFSLRSLPFLLLIPALQFLFLFCAFLLPPPLLPQHRMEQAAQLIAGLRSERSRWEEDSANFADDARRMFGDCVIASAFACYCGPFNRNARGSLLVDVFARECSRRSIPFTMDLDVTSVLCDQVRGAPAPLPNQNTKHCLSIKRTPPLLALVWMWVGLGAG